MITTHPKFSANQVLKHKHLNGLFDYLDEQNRLSRTHLIGLGIVCGLEIGTGQGEVGPGLTISRGCGVTSAGYLLHWENNDVLEFRRRYTIPQEVGDQFFTTYAGEEATQVPLWELAAERDGDDDYVSLDADFLRGNGFEGEESGEKVLLLFLECKETDDENCGPNDCNDEGANVELTLKPLLARAEDLRNIRQRLIDSDEHRAADYFAVDLSRSRRLSLPTLKMPRFDVENSRPATSYDLFNGYRAALSEDVLEGIEAGLEAVYAALNPIIPEVSASPFSNFAAAHTFLHNGRMLDSAVAIYYQPWFDHIRTVVQAYTELKDRAEELYSICCPDEQVFPRHLTLGGFKAGGVIDPQLRHRWVAAPVNGAAGEARAELRTLFLRLYLLLEARELAQPKAEASALNLPGERLVNVRKQLEQITTEALAVNAFANDPAVMAMAARKKSVRGMLTVGVEELDERSIARIKMLSESYNKQLAQIQAVLKPKGREEKRSPLEVANRVNKGNPDVPPANLPIRITPSHLHRPLSERSLPGWYAWENLLEVWNFNRTRRGRSRETLGYRATEWNVNDLIVRSPLNFELEPRDFLRIEGILGAEDTEVLRELRRQVAVYRLPIDVVGIRTGTFDEEQEVEDYDYLFGDLEAQFSAQRERLLSRLAEVASRLYDVRILDNDGKASPQNRLFTPSHPLFTYLPDYRYSEGTVGKHFEDNDGSPQSFFATGLWFYISTAEILEKIFLLVGALPDSLEEVDWPELEAVFLDYEKRIRDKTHFLGLRLSEVENGAPGDFRSDYVDLREMTDQLDILLDGGDRAAFAALVSTSAQRRRDILSRQLFSRFQEEHPGLRYKAGTELGGTFVVVSHGSADGEIVADDEQGFLIAGRLVYNDNPIQQNLVLQPAGSSRTYKVRNGNFRIWVKTLPAEVAIFQVRSFRRRRLKSIVLPDQEYRTIDLAKPSVIPPRPEVPGLEKGTVIASFYLPYRCCSKGNPVVIVPPPVAAPPADPLVVTATQQGCTRKLDGLADKLEASFKLEVSGGVPPYRLERQGVPEDLPANPVTLSNLQSFAIVDGQPARYNLLLAFEELLDAELIGSPVCSEDRQTVNYTLKISGGKPGYHYFAADGQRIGLAADKPVLISLPAGMDNPSVVIFDEHGPNCGHTVSLPQHDCPPEELKCVVPCAGALLHSDSYPLWLQRPVSEKFGVRNLKLAVEELFLCTEVTDDGCKTSIGLDAEQLSKLNARIQEILEAAGTLTSNNFGTAMQSVVRAMSKSVDEVINPKVDISAFGLPLPALTVSSGDGDAFDRLVVGLFRPCHDFGLQIVADYREGHLGNPDRQVTRARRVSYRHAGASFRWADSLDSLKDAEVAATVPSFDRTTVDVCGAGERPKPTCVENKTAAAYQGEEEGAALLFTTTDIGNADRFFWDMPLLNPGIARGKEVAAKIVEKGSFVPPYLLAIEAETGCFSVAKSPQKDGD